MIRLWVVIFLLLSCLPLGEFFSLSFNGITSSYRGNLKLNQQNNKWSPSSSVKPSKQKAEAIEPLVYSLELPKATGIDWGSDLSFRWVYVQSLDPAGAAFKSGKIQKGDYIIGVGNTTLIAQDFNYVLTTLSQQPAISNYTFFRGSKSQLTGEEEINPRAMTYKIKVIEDGKSDRIISCQGGSNLRNVLVNNGINVYRSVTRWTNCSGKQRCGTCIVEIQEGSDNCTMQGLDESAVLRENPESYRLSCVTEIYGDVTVKVLGPVKAAQWTR
eukprot:gene8829-9564_t